MHRHSSAIGLRRCLGFALATAALMLMVPSASAQSPGLLDLLLGRRPPATPVPQQTPIDGTPTLSIVVTPARPDSGQSGSLAHCVRLCDGRHFPLPQLTSGRTTPRALCEALCPASRTKIFWGASIGQAVAAEGTRYSSLDAAFRYRREFVRGCTCNGTDALGTAAISIYADLTLRPGDVVATEEGMQAFVGAQRSPHREIDFVPLQQFSQMPAPLREQLAATRIAPRPDTLRMTFNARVIFGFAPLHRQNATPRSNATNRTNR